MEYRGIGEPRYRRSILVLKPQNGEFESSKSTFSQVFTIVKLRVSFQLTLVKLQLQQLHLSFS